MSTQSKPAQPNISAIWGEGNITEQPSAGSPRAILSFTRLGFIAATLLSGGPGLRRPSLGSPAAYANSARPRPLRPRRAAGASLNPIPRQASFATPQAPALAPRALAPEPWLPHC